MYAKEPLDEYGKDKFVSEKYLKLQYEENGFSYTVVSPGQISGPGWTIINPWRNTSFRVIQDIADGKEIALPNFGQEIIHHVHGYDVAQMFYMAIIHRENAIGRVFDAEAEQHITLYRFAKHLYQFFGKALKIKFLPWTQWCEYEGNPEECEHTYWCFSNSVVNINYYEFKILDIGHFVEMVGYPVIVKPNIGVGATDTYKLENEEQMEQIMTLKQMLFAGLFIWPTATSFRMTFHR